MEEVPLNVLLDEIRRRFDSLSDTKAPTLQCGHRCFTCHPAGTTASNVSTSRQKSHSKNKKAGSTPATNMVHDVFEFDFCSTHGDELNNWCCKCQEATCKTCPEKHYSHGIVLAQDMFLQEVYEKLEKADFEAEIGKKLSQSISDSIDECEEGLRLINEALGVRKQLQSRKNHFVKQQQLLRELTEALKTKEKVDSVQAKHWKLLKIMSRANEDFKHLETKSRAMCADLTKFGKNLEATHKTLQKTSAVIFPSELLPNAANWEIHGEYQTKKALATLRNSGHKPSGPVSVTSSPAKPILSLSELLKSLAKGGHQLKVKLLDSFWARTAPPTDYNRLEPFLKAGHGSSLLSFMGHLTSAEFDGLDARYVRKIGLRIDTAAHASLLHSRQDLKCYRHFCVSTKVVPEDITKSIPEGSPLFCLHFVGLESHNFFWLKEILHKLVPPKRSASLYFPECGFSALEVQNLLEIVGKLGVIPCVWLESDALTEAEKNILEVVAKDVKLEVKWKFVFV